MIVNKAPALRMSDLDFILLFCLTIDYYTKVLQEHLWREGSTNMYKEQYQLQSKGPSIIHVSRTARKMAALHKMAGDDLSQIYYA